ncbi:MAG TPA: YceI family protein [Flavipsychrobacter sp.]|jgi:hypothetical protein|nr:YceI family protein [Flavipsychrobacter sp.]
MIRTFLILILLLSPFFSNAQNVFEVSNGTVSFHSDAPKELISASSMALKGIIDIPKKTFAFKIGISSFMGFNSPLQREHFNENYMETSIFPEAVFLGKIIEDADLSKEGTYVVRAKGKLRIHGIEQERIIRSTVTNKYGKLYIKSDFTVLLADHDIKIPMVVNNKLAPEISVSVDATLTQKRY